MGRLKLLQFGFGFPEMYQTDIIFKKGKGKGFQNTLRNFASNKGLAYLVSPQIGEFWKALVLLKPEYLKVNQWFNYKNLKNTHYRAFLNLQVLDRSEKEGQFWQQCPGYPGLMLQMTRSEKVKIKYETQKKFQEKMEEFEGFEAILIQQAYDYLESLDPLLFANDIKIINSELKLEHEVEIKKLFDTFLKERKQTNIGKLYNFKSSEISQINPYKRIKSFNHLRREIMYCITQNSRN